MKNTAAQKEAMMNDFTFGVEVEMNGITRELAAAVAGSFFTNYKFHRKGHDDDDYQTWSAFDKENREWQFSYDGSIEGPDDERCELITPILEVKDIPILLKLLTEFKNVGAISCPKVGAGVHIHVARKDGFEVKDIKNIVHIMAAHEEQIGRAIKISSDRVASYCKPIAPDFLKMVRDNPSINLEGLKHCWYVGNKAVYGQDDHYNKSRYHMLNLHSFFNGHGTVEFRLFQFSNENGIETKEMEAYILLCLGMCALAHSISRASSKPQQADNEKYAFRCWLLRLGFIGDEFKSARAVLLKNFEGSAAWRNAV